MERSASGEADRPLAAQKFLHYGNGCVSTLFTRARHGTLSWAR